MKNSEAPSVTEKLILRGINLELTAAMRALFSEKSGRLLRHEPRIVRIRIDLEDNSHGGVPQFAAKGHIEISGPDLMASVTTDDAYKSVDGLIDILDRKLRKRTTALNSRRHTGDIRALSSSA